MMIRTDKQYKMLIF